VSLLLTCFERREFIYCGSEMHLVSHIKKRQTSRRNGGDRSSPQIQWDCARITLSQNNAFKLTIHLGAKIV